MDTASTPPFISSYALSATSYSATRLINTQDLVWDINTITNICNGYGYIDLKTGLCNCISNWYGNDCSLRYCPTGKSWISPPQNNHQRYRPRVECSNMGTCDVKTGTCHCRPGYEGRACERSKLNLLYSSSSKFLIFRIMSIIK